MVVWQSILQLPKLIKSAKISYSHIIICMTIPYRTAKFNFQYFQLHVYDTLDHYLCDNFFITPDSLRVVTTMPQYTVNTTATWSTSVPSPSSPTQRSLVSMKTPTSQKTTRRHSYSSTPSYSLYLVRLGAAGNLPNRSSTS